MSAKFSALMLLLAAALACESKVTVAPLDNAGGAPGDAGDETIQQNQGAGPTLPSGPAVAKLVSIALTSGSTTLEAGQTLQLTATGTYDDTSTLDVTADATWTSADAGVATVTATGLVTAAATGTANVTAALDGVTSTTRAVQVVANALAEYSSASITGVVDTDITPSSPTLLTTAPVTFTVSPALPAALALNPSTGEISGYALSALDADFTVTATTSSASQGLPLHLKFTADALDLTTLSAYATLAAPSGTGASLVIGTRLYHFGGNGSGWGDASRAKHVQYAELSDLTAWTSLGAVLPERVWEHQAYLIGSTVYLYGNIEDKKAIYSADTSDLTAWTKHANILPLDLTNGYSLKLGDSLYFWGSEATAADIILSANVATPLAVTDTTARLPTGGTYVHWVSTNHHVYYLLASGNHYDVYRATLTDPTAFTLVGSSPDLSSCTGGIWGRGFVVGEHAYIFGGHGLSCILKAPLSDMTAWEVAPETLTFQRSGQSSIRIGDYLYLVGGRGPSWLGNPTVTRIAITPGS